MDGDRRPQKVKGIEIYQLGDGYVVYQPDRDRVHYLNHTAALVLDLCNGTVAAGEIPDLLEGAYDLPQPPREEVEECLGRLFDEGLLE
jgi:hypothetical protein